MGDEESCEAKVLQCVVQSIQRVSREELFGSIVSVADHLWNELKQSSDTRFYVSLSGDNYNSCFSKSTLFVSVMLMDKRNELSASFQGILCHGHMLEGVVSPTIQHVVYADDGSFSGTQQDTADRWYQRRPSLLPAQ